MLLEYRSNENQMRKLLRRPLLQWRTYAVCASWEEVSGCDCVCGESGESGEHSKRWQFWWEMMRDGSQRFCDSYRWCTAPRDSAAAVAGGSSLDIYLIYRISRA